MCILNELYYEWHSPRERSWKEIQEKWDLNEELWTQAEKYLNAELFEKLQFSVSQLIDLESCREFQEGFRLGVQLMLELRLNT